MSDVRQFVSSCVHARHTLAPHTSSTRGGLPRLHPLKLLRLSNNKKSGPTVASPQEAGPLLSLYRFF